MRLMKRLVSVDEPCMRHCDEEDSADEPPATLDTGKYWGSILKFPNPYNF